LFVAHCLVAQHKVSRLPGSGIDLKKFCFTPLKDSTHRPLNFLLVSRLLWDKGVGEYVEAARLVKRQYPGVSFQILGFFDEKNPREVSRAQMQIWDREGVIDYLGVSDDVQSFMVAADCIVLPSYREGVPRTLLEAAAIGRPIVTTDVTGCRDAVDDGVNGFLCNIRDAHDLADKMTQMIELLPSKRMAMGVAGRAKMEIQFDESIVINSYLNTIESILSN
jgi:glycosyltransferase involved in cell wall biosynthesis